MISKPFVLSGTGFTVEVPQDYQDKYKTQISYSFTVKKAPDAAFYFVTLVDGTPKGSYLGIIWPDKGVLLLTKNSKFKAYSMPVIIAKHALSAVWEGRNTDVKGWVVRYTNAPVTPAPIQGYGAPVITSNDIITNGGYEHDCWGDPHDQWEEEAYRENQAEAQWS
jgi:hypothetical protein